MKFVLHHLALETTRRCNLRCEHCMRGASQDIDLSPEIVDLFLENDGIKCIESICFSGGEPTLNPDIIVYTINKIINENIAVDRISMVTNGQIYSPKIVDVFNRFNEYRSRIVRKSIEENNSYSDELKETLLRSISGFARITFSTDPYHKEISDVVRRQYEEDARGLEITEFCVKDEDIYQTGFATMGKPFEYGLESLKYYGKNDEYDVLGSVYVTATGVVTSEGMGQYTDMDKINFGTVENLDLEDILVEHGRPLLNTLPIAERQSVLMKKI